MVDTLQRDIAKLSRKLGNISKTAIPKADAVALNQTANRIKTQVIKTVASENQIQQKYIRKRVYSRIRISKDYRQGTITAYRRDVPAISLGIATSMVKKAKGRRLISAAGRNVKGRFTKREFAGNTAIKVGRNTYQNAFVNRARGSWQIMRRLGKKAYPIEVIKVKISDSVDRCLPQFSRNMMKNAYPSLLQYELQRRLKQYENKS